jgi:hypothetical protein
MSQQHQPENTSPSSPTDPLTEYRLTKLEEAVSQLSDGFKQLLNEIQRAKWVIGGALLVSQGEDILKLINHLNP